MIIPIRCMNCGNPLADKWLYYQEKVKQLRGQGANGTEDQLIYMDGQTVPQTPEAAVLRELQLTRYCCRKHMLTHVDLMDKI